MNRYYFDHAASAPRRDEVTEAMAPFMHGVVGNPSGAHAMGRAARLALEEARDVIAELVGAEPGAVIFTGGGTESCNLAISGVTLAHAASHDATELVVSQIEHHAVGDAAEWVASLSPTTSLRTLGVDADGVVDLGQLDTLVTARTALVSVMTANNETGVIQPIADVARVARAHNPDVIVHTDAIAAAPWLDLREAAAGADLVTICAHKLGGPVNSGALVMRRSVPIHPLAGGGGQERGLRGGTQDVAAAVGLAASLLLIERDRRDANARAEALRERLIAAVGAMPGARVTALSATRLPGTVHVTFENLVNDELIFLLDQEGVCASGAAAWAEPAKKSGRMTNDE